MIAAIRRWFLNRKIAAKRLTIKKLALQLEAVLASPFSDPKRCPENAAPGWPCDEDLEPNVIRYKLEKARIELSVLEALARPDLPKATIV